MKKEIMKNMAFFCPVWLYITVNLLVLQFANESWIIFGLLAILNVRLYLIAGGLILLGLAVVFNRKSKNRKKLIPFMCLLVFLVYGCHLLWWHRLSGGWF